MLWDNNAITIDGKVSIADVTDQKARFAASGWDVFECDGHDPADIDRALTAARASDRPAFVACKTHIALGSSAQDTSKGHGALTDAKLIADTRAAYGWDYGPFEIPPISARPGRPSARGAMAAREAWEARFAALPAAKQAEFTRIMSGAPASEAGAGDPGREEEGRRGAARRWRRGAPEIVLEA